MVAEVTAVLMGKQVGFTQGELDVEVVCVVGWVRQVIRFCPLLSARAIASYLSGLLRS